MTPPCSASRLVAGATWSALLVALSGAGCVAPQTEEGKNEGSLAEIGRMMDGAEPVQAVQLEGEQALEAQEPALPTQQEMAEALAESPPPLARQDPYIRFGERIIVRDFEGGPSLITKPYSMPPGKAERLLALIGALQPFPVRARPAPDPATGIETPFAPSSPPVLEYQVLEDWDEEFYSKLLISPDGTPPAAPTPVVLSDVIVITAPYELLEQFEDFLDLFAVGGVPQIELEAKIIEVVETDQLDVGGNALFSFGDSNFVQALDFDFPNLATGTEALLDLGAVQSSFVFDAMLEAVRTWDNVQIDSRPKTVVRAGGIAYIESTTEIPFSEVKFLAGGDFTTSTVYKKVGVQLYISPRIIGTKMLALDVHLIGSQQVGSQATFSTGGDGEDNDDELDFFIEVPVIASRTAKTVVYLEPGQTLLIGGLTTQRDRELISKVPVLGDLPLIGVFFRSTFTRSEKQHVLFAISPRILQYSDFETGF